MSDLGDHLQRRACLVIRLNRAAAEFEKWRWAKAKPPHVLDTLFVALADAGDWNRLHTDISIPRMVDGKVPLPAFGPPIKSDTADPAGVQTA